jgi:spore coat protein H
MRCLRWLAVACLVACGGGGEGDGDGDDDDSEVPPRPDAGLVCDPQAGGPYWLTEGETVTVRAECATGLTSETLTIEPLPDGAEWDAESATLTWTPGLDQAAVYELEVTGASEVGQVKIGVADRWDDPDNQPVDPLTYTEEYGLPVFHLDSSPDINGDDYTPATIIYRGHEYAGTEAKNRGASSLDYPKKSFTLKFTREDKFSDEPRQFLGKRKVVLNTTFDDNSYLRQRLVYELWNRLDPEHIQIQHYSAVLFLDGVYHGVYEVLDHVDGYLMEDHGLRQDGNLYKSINHDANFRLLGSDDQPKQTLHDGYEKKEGTPLEGEAGAFADLEELVEWVANATPTQFAAQLEERIDRRDFEDWWLLIALTEADDSAGKNCYLYHDPVRGGPFRYIPWDFNHSYGQDWETFRQAADVDPEDYTWANAIFERLLTVPSTGDPLRARFREALDGVWRVDTVLAFFDAFVAEMDAAVRRDEERWGAEYAAYWDRDDLTTYDQEIAYVRAWIEERWAFVADFYAAPSLAHP